MTATTTAAVDVEPNPASVTPDGDVRLVDVTVRFGTVVALDGLDLTVEPRELLVVLGPSACGKTTILRTIAGLDEPSAGAVWIGGRPVADVDPKDRDVAMVFQSYALYPQMTVAENIAFPLRKRGVPRRQREAIVAEAAATIGLGDVLDRRPGQLSGGQRQRVALARAIVRRPRVFLMDEPLSNLDGPLRAAARAELTDLHRRLGTTFVYVTHDQVEAMTMATRIAVMDRGRLQQIGMSDEIYSRPANTFVAGFVGTPGMNLMAGRVDGGRAVVAGGSLPVNSPAADRDLVVGVRSEHLRQCDGDRDADLALRVQSVESHGHDHLVRAAAGAGAVFVRVAAGQSVPAAGDVIRLRARPGNVHLFEAATGQRIPSTGE